MTMLSPESAARFAQDWIDAWNRRDLDAVMSYYSDDTEFSSPFVQQLSAEPSGVLRGKRALRAFWEHALNSDAAIEEARPRPPFRLTLLHVLLGHNSVCLVYEGLRDWIERKPWSSMQWGELRAPSTTTGDRVGHAKRVWSSTGAASRGCGCWYQASNGSQI